MGFVGLKFLSNDHTTPHHTTPHHDTKYGRHENKWVVPSWHDPFDTLVSIGKIYPK